MEHPFLTRSGTLHKKTNKGLSNRPHSAQGQVIGEREQLEQNIANIFHPHLLKEGVRVEDDDSKGLPNSDVCS